MMRSGILLFATAVLLVTTPASAVLFRLPLAVDSTIHFYYDHDSGSGVSDWKCGTQTYDGHSGTDFTGGNAGRFTPIYAAAGGTVITSIDGYGDGFGGNTDGGGAGNHVVLGHSSSPNRTHYLHMNLGSVTGSSSVSCGQQIGRIGTSGNSTGLHLHFEPRNNGVADDPYAGPCGGPTSFWVDQTGGSPSTSCQGMDISPPSNLAATTSSSNRINLNWTDNSFIESNYQIERSLYPIGPWILIGVIPANSTSFISSNLLAGTTYFYRVKAFNSVNDSPYSLLASANTSNTPPNLAAITDKIITEGNALSFNVSAVDSGGTRTWSITDFDNIPNDGANGVVMFREPSFSITSRAFLNTSPDAAFVTAYFPVGNGSRRTLLANWSFTSSAVNPWMRFTTQNATTFPNPTIGFGQIFRFDIFTERSVKVALGLRETNTGAEPGEDGGVSGQIEFVGVPNVVSNAPDPSRTVGIRAWQHVELNIPFEPISSFSGNGILQSTTGKGALEHLTIVPDDGSGEYRVWLDNFSVTQTNVITFSLEPGAPAGAAINPLTGAFLWTPTEEQGPGNYPITIRATDNGSPAMSDTETFLITVNESNQPPALAFISDKVINAGASIAFTNSAIDQDVPTNQLSFSLDVAPANAGINSTSGIFSWTAPAVTMLVTNPVTIRVADNGSPSLSDTESFQLIVVPPPRFSSVQSSSGEIIFGWETYPGKNYQIQFKNDLNETPWQNFGSNIVAEGTSLSVTNSPTNGQRFYRVQQLD